MSILIFYILIVLVGESMVAALGLYLDRASPAASLPVSMTLFFFVLWLAWILAVRLTATKPATKKS